MRNAWVAAVVAALLLAGCTAPDGTRPADGESPGIAPGVPQTEASAPRAGDGWDLKAHTINQGEQGVDYRKGCGHEWDWVIVDPDEEPVPLGHANCLGFSEAELGPGESLDFLFHWNGTAWNDTAGRYEPVPAGTYVFRIAFLYDDGERAEGEAFVHVD